MRFRIAISIVCFSATVLAFAVAEAAAQSVTVTGYQKIDSEDLPGQLDDWDRIGRKVRSLGDLDGDGIEEVAVAADRDGDGGPIRGALWIMFLRADGTVKSHKKISDEAGNFGGDLDDGDQFGGGGAALLGDLDGDGISELAVGASHDDDGGINRGATWILFMNADQTVKSEMKISSTSGGFGGFLSNSAIFGSSVDSLGDLDGNGITELAVGARRNDGSVADEGAIWVLFLNSNGNGEINVVGHQKIDGHDVGGLDSNDNFGQSSVAPGDIDGDGVPDLIVSATLDDDGGVNRGAVYVLLLNEDGSVRYTQKISHGKGGLGEVLDDGDEFGNSLAMYPDLDGDGRDELLVGSVGDDEAGVNHGAIWLLSLNADGSVKSSERITDNQPGFFNVLTGNEQFGAGVESPGDINGDGIDDLVVGDISNPGGGDHRGAVWVLFLGYPDTEGPIVTDLIATPNPVEVNTATTLTASIDDSATGGSTIASAEHSIDGGSGVPMTPIVGGFDEVTEGVTAVIPGQSTGVYEICVNGTDSAGNTGENECILVPFYDPNGGFVTGGGWVNSPSSADLENGESGKATFGFVSKYLPGQSTPDGNLQFRFKNGDINFHSTSMDWLVVTGEPRAMFRGDGLLNGSTTCKFEVDAWDASSDGEDAFGLKIFACGPGNDRYNLPATALVGGNIKIHQN